MFGQPHHTTHKFPQLNIVLTYDKRQSENLFARMIAGHQNTQRKIKILFMSLERPQCYSNNAPFAYIFYSIHHSQEHHIYEHAIWQRLD